MAEQKSIKSQQNPLSIKKISKSFGNKTVIENVSLEIAPGEMFGLIGLNGVGKTTLIKIILGLLGQDSGDATIFGENINKVQTRNKLSYLPEKFHPSTFLKGWEFLVLTLSYYKQELDRDEALKHANILKLDPAALDRKISSYSKGMVQKLGLLSALLSKRPLLILDEPMSGLDPSARIYLKETLQSYIKKGNTIFFSSHILSDIDEICDRVGIIHDQKLIFVGTPKAFKTKYKEQNLERAFLKAIAA